MNAPGALGCACLVGYCLGCLDAAWIIGFLRGVDIKSAGNGNAGASNALMTMGAGPGIATALWDISKAILAYAMTGAMLGWPRVPCLVAAGVAVIGHVWPFWLGFDGGKGFAPYLGFMLCVDWRTALVMAAAGAVMVLASDHIIAMTFLFIAGGPVSAWFHEGTWCALLAACLSVILLWRHRENVADLVHGREQSVRGAIRNALRRRA